MTPTEFDGEDAEAPFPGLPKLRSRTTTNAEGTEECTIYPAEATADQETTAWITAEGNAYVELERMR
jgi:hypothetical protein